jgi:hypothetical protein
VHQHPLNKTNFVPLPKRGRPNGSHHQIALLIREGRRVAAQLTTAADASHAGSSKETLTNTTMTTVSTMLEQDFTVEGKKGELKCPFSAAKSREATITQTGGVEDNTDPTPHKSADPICAAMLGETDSQAAHENGTPAQCPIRFLDQHSPEEIANYVEKHKHQIPRSHELCVRRYQKNEDQIRKLDAKYGNLVSMIQDLSHLHQPMLPTAASDAQQEVDRASNERVESWAQEVTASGAENPDEEEQTAREASDAGDDHDRDSHFDRPLKEVRVGESPSRPWGISVPLFDGVSRTSHVDQRPSSPPPAPVRMPTPEPAEHDETAPASAPRKCPFDHTRFTMPRNISSSPAKAEEEEEMDQRTHSSAYGQHAMLDEPITPLKTEIPLSSPPQPAFINPESPKAGHHDRPQMLFTGPVFIGYPVEQAIQFMQHFQGR